MRQEMIQLVEKAIARLLYNKLMEHFDDLEALSQIQSSQDFALICELESSFKNEKEDRDVDYCLVVGAWNELYNSVKQLNTHYKDFIVHISKEFNVNINDDFGISGSLYDHEKLFIRKLDEKWVGQYTAYIFEMNKIICRFNDLSPELIPIP